MKEKKAEDASLEIDVISGDGKVSGKKSLPASIANALPNKHLVHEVIRAYLANQRRGTHDTLTRGEVTGGSKKPWKQKHTGRARAGTTRSPLWRKGGIIHGPKPRSYRIDVPSAKVKAALHQVFSAKALSGQLVVAEAPRMEAPKTKSVTQWLKALSFPRKSVLITEKADEKLLLAVRNLADFKVLERRHIHPYQILNSQKVILTPESAEALQ